RRVLPGLAAALHDRVAGRRDDGDLPVREAGQEMAQQPRLEIPAGAEGRMLVDARQRHRVPCGAGSASGGAADPSSPAATAARAGGARRAPCATAATL